MRAGALWRSRPAPGIEVPVLLIGGTADHDAPFEWSSRLAYEHVSSERRALVPVPEAGHMSFTNPCETTRRLVRIAAREFCFDAHWDRTEAHRVIAHHTTWFLIEVFRNDPLESVVGDW